MYSDNIAVVHVATSGNARDAYLAACARNLWWLAALWDIDLMVKHVSGRYNIIGDSLSRLFSPNPINLDLIERLRLEKSWANIEPGQFAQL